MATFNFTLNKTEINKKIQLNVNVDDWKDFRNTLKTFQKDVNEYLTELVDSQKGSGENDAIDIEEDEDSDDSENNDNKTIKRMLEPPDKKSKMQKS